MRKLCVVLGLLVGGAILLFSVISLSLWGLGIVNQPLSAPILTRFGFRIGITFPLEVITLVLFTANLILLGKGSR